MAWATLWLQQVTTELLCSSHGAFWVSVYLCTQQLLQGHRDREPEDPVGKAAVDGSFSLVQGHTLFWGAEQAYRPSPAGVIKKGLLVARRPAEGNRVSASVG